MTTSKNKGLTIFRTNGRTRDCKGCRFWSELYARQEGKGPLRAMCLNRNSPYTYLYTSKDQSCDAWADGEWGAIDDPANKGVY